MIVSFIHLVLYWFLSQLQLRCLQRGVSLFMLQGRAWPAASSAGTAKLWPGSGWDSPKPEKASARIDARDAVLVRSCLSLSDANRCLSRTVAVPALRRATNAAEAPSPRPRRDKTDGERDTGNLPVSPAAPPQLAGTDRSSPQAREQKMKGLKEKQTETKKNSRSDQRPGNVARMGRVGLANRPPLYPTRCRTPPFLFSLGPRIDEPRFLARLRPCACCVGPCRDPCWSPRG